MANEEGMKRHICKLLIQPSDKVVKDHCLFSGKFSQVKRDINGYKENTF